MGSPKLGRNWSWREEQPGAVIVVVLILAFAFMFPHDSCQAHASEPPAQTQTAGE